MRLVTILWILSRRILPILAFSAIAPLSAQTAPSAAQAQPFSPAAEVNTALPSWVRFSGEYRARFEGFTGGSGFKPDTTDAYWLSRVRLDLTIQPVSWLRFFIEGQDARAIAKQPGVPPFENVWDLRQAYGELGDIEKQTFGLRVGRQEINFGDQRLVGSTNWSNAARTFDAVRGTVRHGGYRLDLFAASVVNAVNDTWDHHQQGNNLHGAHGEITKLVPRATIEPYVYWRLQPRVRNEAGVVANMNEWVPGVRWVGTLRGGFDYQLEMVREAGSLGSDNIHAWAGHWVIGRTAASVRMTPRIWVEYNYATGDRNAKDGVRGTFDQLYPTAHDKYGLADQVGWKNTKHMRVGVEIKPAKSWSAMVEYTNYYLASPFDALYTTSSTAIARSATGTAGTHVGQELDVVGAWNVSKALTAGAGFGHLFPGEFLRKTTPANPYNFPYVMFTYKF